MPKLILMVDADASLRGQVEKALSARGYEFKENANGKDVMEQVRSAQPSAVILNVELPKGSGYAICSKIRKDDGLKGTKLLLTSAEATQKAFDDHKKLKLGRADDYLLKPFPAEELVKRVLSLLGDDLDDRSDEALGMTSLAAEFGDPADEERISLDDIEEISVEDEPGPNPGSLPGERDVDLLESAFQELEAHPANAPTAPAEPSSHLDSADRPEPKDEFQSETTFPSDSLQDQANEVLQALESEPSPDEPTVSGGASISAPPISGDTGEISRLSEVASAGSGRDKEYFQLKEKLNQRERDLLRSREELNAREKELLEQRDRETQIERELGQKDQEIAKRDAQTRQLQQKVESLVAGQRRSERDLQAAREEARTASQRADDAERASAEAREQAREKGDSADHLASDLQSAQQRLEQIEAEAERLRSRNDELEAELNGVRAQLEEASATNEDLRQQHQRDGDENQIAQQELRRQLEDLEREREKDQERLVRAHERLQTGEKVREKARQTLTLALDLLQESVEDQDLGEADAQPT
jgi:CheY-like chemotaxis protein